MFLFLVYASKQKRLLCFRPEFWPMIPCVCFTSVIRLLYCLRIIFAILVSKNTYNYLFLGTMPIRREANRRALLRCSFVSAVEPPLVESVIELALGRLGEARR
jgi:hypothetical protein